MRKLIKEVVIKIGDNYIVETHYKDKKENICIKSKINKISDNKYVLITYDNIKKDNNSIKSKIIYNKEQIEELIKEYLYLYNCEIEVEYK